MAGALCRGEPSAGAGRGQLRYRDSFCAPKNCETDGLFGLSFTCVEARSTDGFPQRRIKPLPVGFAAAPAFAAA
eukprot:3257198-Pyramimonas_sp.AAC.1